MEDEYIRKEQVSEASWLKERVVCNLEVITELLNPQATLL